jgi:hypothetical protein
MKRSLSWLLAALVFISCGGGDNGTGPGNGGNNNKPKPQPTAVGSPDGNATSQTIGAAGGSVMSEDSTLTVTIPAGALSSDTLITVQPITNTAWGGVGKGYRLTPHGLHFNVPVSLAFKVAPEDLASTAPAFLDVAVQDAQGFWYILKNRAYDDVARVITVTTPHFSDYSNVDGWQILPASATTAPLGTVDLTVKGCDIEEYTDPEGYLAWRVAGCFELVFEDEHLSNWSVNGVKGGSAATGTVVATGTGNYAQLTQARYTAPASVPLSNPVAVSIAVAYKRDRYLLVSNITIAGDFKGDVTRVTGSGAVGEKAEWHMSWASSGSYDDVETFTGAGTLDYTPQTLPCPHHTFEPTSVPVSSAYMIIDRRTVPYTVTVAISADWDVHECDDCNGNEICTDYHFQHGFSDGGTGTISADGKTISGDYHDDGSGEDWTYSFTQ